MSKEHASFDRTSKNLLPLKAAWFEVKTSTRTVTLQKGIIVTWIYLYLDAYFRIFFILLYIIKLHKHNSELFLFKDYILILKEVNYS